MLQKLIAGIGLVLVATGLCIGLIPGSAGYGSASFSCGSAWVRDHNAEQARASAATIDDAQHGLGGVVDEQANFTSLCDEVLAGRAVSAIILAGLGAATLIASYVVVAVRYNRRLSEAAPGT
jgi:hypothetical protein